MTLQGSGHVAQSTGTPLRPNPAQPSLTIQPVTNLYCVASSMHGCFGSHCHTERGGGCWWGM